MLTMLSNGRIHNVLDGVGSTQRSGQNRFQRSHGELSLEGQHGDLVGLSNDANGEERNVLLLNGVEINEGTVGVDTRRAGGNIVGERNTSVNESQTGGVDACRQQSSILGNDVDVDCNLCSGVQLCENGLFEKLSNENVHLRQPLVVSQPLGSFYGTERCHVHVDADDGLVGCVGSVVWFSRTVHCADYLCVAPFDVRRAIGRGGVGVDFAVEIPDLIPSSAVCSETFRRIYFVARLS